MAFRPKIKDINGNLTDLPIAAETAVKLKSARSIGLSGVQATSQSFNGTSAITIPITGVPASLLTGVASIDTFGTAAKAGMLSDYWIELTPGSTVLPYGTYMIKVVLADGSSGIGNYGTTFTDIISMAYSDLSDYVYRGFDLPSGPLHIYVSNGYESAWMKTTRVKVTNYTTAGFRINLYLSNTGGYSTTTPISGGIYFPTTLASSISNVSYTIYYRRIM